MSVKLGIIAIQTVATVAVAAVIPEVVPENGAAQFGEDLFAIGWKSIIALVALCQFCAYAGGLWRLLPQKDGVPPYQVSRRLYWTANQAIGGVAGIICLAVGSAYHLTSAWITVVIALSAWGGGKLIDLALKQMERRVGLDKT